jgi:tetratricopeptide (TPR) repeat protein
VAHVLTGGVRKDGDRLRVSVELVSAADGFELWSETYDRPVGDVFAIEDDIAARVSEALRLTLGVGALEAGSGTRNFEAYDHYLRGRAYAAQSGAEALSAALEEFRRATEADPAFGPAWASMARAADFMVVNEPGRAEELRALQEHATRKAREVAPTDWETVALEARLLMRAWDWSGAADALQRAGDSSHATPVEAAEIEGVFLMQVGRAREARSLFEAARASEPLSFAMSASTAWALELTGDLDAALAEYARAETLPGDDTDWAFQQLLRLLAQGDPAAVDAHFATYPYQEDGVGALFRRLAEVWRSPEPALALLREAKDDPAIRGPHRLDGFAVLAAYYGDAELALALDREELFGRRGGATVHLWHPFMSKVRRTDGFESLVRDVGLVDYWRASGSWSDFCRPLDETDFECM